MSNETSEPKTVLVYKQIHAVMKNLAESGIKKSAKMVLAAASAGKNEKSYLYRTIEDVYEAMARALCACELVILPRVVHKQYDCLATPTQYNKDATTNRCLITVEYTIVAMDGSSHVVTSIGEAFNNGDKGTGAAISYAYKNMVCSTFAVPVEGLEDTDKQNVTQPALTMLTQAEFDAIAAQMRASQDVDAVRALCTANWHRMAPQQRAIAQEIGTALKNRLAAPTQQTSEQGE